MICDDVRKYDYTYLDDEFDRRERAEFEAHITACPPCRDHVARAARFREGVRKHLRCDEAPSHLRGRVCAGLDAAEGGHGMPRWAIPLALAASLGVVTVGWQYVVETAPAGGSMIGHVGGRVAAAPVKLVVTPTKVAGVTGVRNSDPKRMARRYKPAMRVTRSLRSNVEYCESENKMAVRQVEHVGSTEVIGGGVNDDFLAKDGQYEAIRTAANLRALVSSHRRPLPPEVAGTARVQDWLRRAAPGHSALPIAEGAGVRLLGARLGHLGGHRVVAFRYRAFDKPVTVVRYLPAGRGDDDRPEPMPSAQPNGAVRDLVAGYSVVHTAKNGDVLSIVSELEHQALLGIIEPPSFL
ncbi:MAG: zf-HC2 domain-containing protein [Myxococcales bacterium]|nr:zf-HC2 domain-containing protein [Myxococcales bacterium]